MTLSWNADTAISFEGFDCTVWGQLWTAKPANHTIPLFEDLTNYDIKAESFYYINYGSSIITSKS